MRWQLLLYRTTDCHQLTPFWGEIAGHLKKAVGAQLDVCAPSHRNRCARDTKRLPKYQLLSRAMSIETVYLREQANRCIRLARQCSDRQTSYALEVMSIDLVEKAAEWEKMQSLPPQTNRAPGQGTS